MASVDKRGDSYRIRVSRGYDSQGKKQKPYSMTWTPEPNMTAKQIEKELKRQETLFEEKCKQGLAGDGRQKFEEYAVYVINLKDKSGEIRHNTLVRYRECMERTFQELGHMKVEDIRPQHLNAFYEKLGEEGVRKGSDKAKLLDGADLRGLIKSNGHTNLLKFSKEQANIAHNTLSKALKGENINLDIAESIAVALNTPVKKLFEIIKDNTPLSPVTIRKYHIFCQVVLKQAVLENLIPYNPADRAKPPKTAKKEANYFEADEVAEIIQAAENIPLKWRVLIHIMLVTGGRRGEVLGLQWKNVDFTFNRIYIDSCAYYRPDVGIFIDKPKTEKSVRWIKLPESTMQMLKQYKEEYYEPLKTSAGSKWNDSGFVFIKDSGADIGKVMHPDSATTYCDKFSKQFGLRHINPHAFRHTAVSLLYFAGMDIVSISAHLGHSQVSTTQNLYAHVMAEAESKIADCMGDIIITSRKKRFPANSESTDNTKDKTEIKTG